MEPQQGYSQPQPSIQVIPGQPPQIGNQMRPPAGKKKILLFAAAGGIGLIVLLIIVSLLAGGQSLSSKYMGKVVARNEEMIRILDEYGKEARGKDVSIQIASSKLILFSDTQALKEAGFSTNAKQLELVTTSNIDSQITDSIAQGRFDQFIQDYLKDAFEQNISDIDLAMPEIKKDSTKSLLEMLRQNYEDLK